MTGTVTISIEVELGWGVIDLDYDHHLSEDGREERRFLRKVLDACDASSVPITFDVVGHLMLDSCSGRHEGPYPERWFDADPGTDARSDPLYYAPEMVDAIRSREADHELCTHTFAHLPANEATPAMLAQDLSLAQRTHREYLGERTTSLVPPRHYVPPTDVMADAGIGIVRERAPSDAAGLARARELLVGPPRTPEPTVDNGVVTTYCTSSASLTSAALPLGQRDAHVAFRYLPVGLRQRLHRKYLDRAVRAAIERDAHVHLWTHLCDLSNPAQFRAVAGFLDRLGDLRAAGEVDVLTMEALEDRVRDRAATSPSPSEAGVDRSGPPTAAGDRPKPAGAEGDRPDPSIPEGDRPRNPVARDD